jgi:hypothetical protein
MRTDWLNEPVEAARELADAGQPAAQAGDRCEGVPIAQDHFAIA